MNIEEINIGNILRCTGPLCGEVEVAVDGVQASGKLRAHCVSAPGVCEMCRFHVNVQKFAAVPITPAILAASGFVYSEHNGFFVMLRVGGRDNSIRVTPHGDLYDVEVFASHPQLVITENFIKGVRFVHQLQNAYALATGGKLEIKVRKYEEQDLACYPLLPT